MNFGWRPSTMEIEVSKRNSIFALRHFGNSRNWMTSPQQTPLPMSYNHSLHSAWAPTASRWSPSQSLLTDANVSPQLLFPPQTPPPPEVATQLISHTSCRACTVPGRCQHYARCCTERANKNQSLREEVHHREQELQLYCFKFKAVKSDSTRVL